ncbi:hypothetical protein Tco_0755200 [Tanacetum coccineum]
MSIFSPFLDTIALKNTLPLLKTLMKVFSSRFTRGNGMYNVLQFADYEMMLEGGTMGSAIMRFTFTVSADGSRLIKFVHCTIRLILVNNTSDQFSSTGFCGKLPALYEDDQLDLSALSEASVFTQYYCSKWSKILLYSRVVKATEYSRIIISHGTIFYLVPNTFLGLLSSLSINRHGGHLLYCFSFRNNMLDMGYDTENGSGSGAGSWGQKAVSKNETGWCMKRTENEAAWSSKKPEKETKRVWSPRDRDRAPLRVKRRSWPLQPQAEVAKDSGE